VKIAILPGDGIGPEIVAEAVRVLERLRSEDSIWRSKARLSAARVYDASGQPLPDATLELRGAPTRVVSAPSADRATTLCRARCARAGILALRKALGLFANLRPAILYPELAARPRSNPRWSPGSTS
jgi:3-isopropylmalate dehydrogenase